jgi:glutaredoxin 3
MEAFKEYLAAHRVVMVSKTTCGYCSLAKKLLVLYVPERDIKELKIDEMNNGRQIWEAAFAMSGRNTVPNIFIRGNYIGGYDTISSMHERGTLRSLFEE